MEFSPSSGPKAGGTRVTFQGRNLDTGANVCVLFDDAYCHVEGLVGISHRVVTCDLFFWTWKRLLTLLLLMFLWGLLVVVRFSNP